jgi:hypothetical protein
MTKDEHAMTRATLLPGFALGMVADWRGQQFELVEVRPYRRRDGGDSLILVWRGHCLACGAAFTITAPQRKLKYPVRRCPEHVKKRLVQ